MMLSAVSTDGFVQHPPLYIHCTPDSSRNNSFPLSGSSDATRPTPATVSATPERCVSRILRFFRPGRRLHEFEAPPRRFSYAGRPRLYERRRRRARTSRSTGDSHRAASRNRARKPAQTSSSHARPKACRATRSGVHRRLAITALQCHDRLSPRGSQADTS